MISSDIVLIGTTIHRVAQLIQQRIDKDIRDSGLTRLSWIAAAHLEDAPGPVSYTHLTLPTIYSV